MENYKELLESEDYLGAIKALKNDQTLEAPIKYYNIGYSYFKRNEYVKARYYYEKARVEGLVNDELNNSLEIVKQNLGVAQVESDYRYLDKTLLTLSPFKNEVFLSLLGIFLLVILWSILKAKKALVIVFVILFFGVGGLMFSMKDYKVVLLKEEAYVHQGPSRIFDPTQLILPGTKVMIENESKDWKYVKYPLMYRGWIYKAKVRKL